MTEVHHWRHRDSGEGHSPSSTQGYAGLDYYGKRIMAIKELLLEKGTISTDDLERKADNMEERSVADGARVVARAWLDPKFKVRLLTDPRGALTSLGHRVPVEMNFQVVENTDKLHHLVVCTLCSCYPGWLLGRPPDWYRSLAYRSRAVVTPRSVMAEFGLTLDKTVEVRVLDSTADMRYMVLPRRPPATESLAEEELARLVTRDSLIGVADPLPAESHMAG